MKKAIIIFVIILAVIAAVVAFTTGTDNNQPVDNQTAAQEQQTDNQPGQSESANQTFTLDQVAGHNSSSDCWTIIHGDVYNVTNYISLHPGGNEILRACGTDATSLFETRTTEDGEVLGGGPHSSDARSILAQFKIGVLAE